MVNAGERTGPHDGYIPGVPPAKPDFNALAARSGVVKQPDKYRSFNNNINAQSKMDAPAKAGILLNCFDGIAPGWF